MPILYPENSPMTVFYQDERGHWVIKTNPTPDDYYHELQKLKRDNLQKQDDLRQRLATDMRALLNKKIIEDETKNQGTTMPTMFDRNGHPVQPGDYVTVYNVPGLPKLHGTTHQLVQVDSNQFMFRTDDGRAYYTNEVEYAETPEISDRKGYLVKPGDRVRVFNVPGISRLNGTEQVLTEVGATSRHGRFGFNVDMTGVPNTVYTNEVELIFEDEISDPLNPNGSNLMDKMTFAAEVLEYLQDERSHEVYIADPDGDVFELRKILFNPENGRIYLVRDYDTELPSDRYVVQNT